MKSEKPWGPLLACLLLGLLPGCGEAVPFEGDEAGECTDRADNDVDGQFDCDDPDCLGSPDCEPEELVPDPSLDACGDEGEEPAASCLVQAEVTVVPPDVEPGAPYTVAVWIPHGDAQNVELSVGGLSVDPPLSLSAEGGGFSGEASLVAGNELGDHLVAVEGEHDRGLIAGYALLNVTALGSCPDGQVREAGGCIPPESGLPLFPQLMFRTPYATPLIDIDGEPAPDDGNGGPDEVRTMLHPRRVFRSGQALVACLTDSVAVIDVGSMFPIDLDPGSGSQNRPPFPMERAEGLLDPGGLAYCDDLAVDLERGLAVATTRGALAQPAGLTTWLLPDLSAAPFDDPVLLHTYEDAEGFEGATLADGYLYAAHKPGSVAVYQLSDVGELSLVSETPLPGATSPWSVLKEGDRLYVTDAGVHPDRPEGEPTGGGVYVLDVADPLVPVVLGSAPTEGLPKSIAASGDGQVVLGSGKAGMEIFDVSGAGDPIRLLHELTPGSAISVGWSDGYILLSDWGSIRLYDAGERGVLRLIWATDLSLGVMSDLPPGPEYAFDNSGFTHLSGSDFIVTDMDTILLGTIQPGRRSPSVNLVDRRWSIGVSEPTDQQQLVLRFANGGRTPLEVTIREQENIVPSGQSFLVAPGVTEAIEFSARNLGADNAPDLVWLDTNDPMRPVRRAQLVRLMGGLETGDLIPDFRLPIINQCDGETCTTEPECFQLYDAQWEGIPILIAFFTSW